ncbi:MAG: choice-of-anchor Q domain-containing protein [Ilumatobacteraceae bacterium]|nr:choice-of-anchor Q domain-containing protein [Ilumatobacteraceae bacterium]
MGDTAGAAIGSTTGRELITRRRSPDLRGPLISLVVAALVTSVSTVVPALLPNDPSSPAAEPAATAAATAQVLPPGTVPEGLTLDEWTTIRREVAAAEAVRVEPAPVVRSAAPVPELSSGSARAEFVAGAAVVTVGSGPEVSFTTSRIGDVVPVATAPSVAGDRVEFVHRATVTEWFRETTAGLQQGFTIGAPTSADPRVEIEVAVDGGTPRLVDEQSVTIDRVGAAPLAYRELMAWDATGTPLPAAMSVVGDVIVLTVDTTGATYPVTVDPIISEDTKLLPAADAAGDLMGEVVAIDTDAPGGAIAVVSATGDDDLGPQTGAVYVFREAGGTWDREATLFSPVPAAEQFGGALAVSGDAIAVGAPGADGEAQDSGAVYVYEHLGGGNWAVDEVLYECDLGFETSCTNTGPFPAAGETIDSYAGRAFGRALAFDGSGTLLLVGVPGGGLAPADNGTAYLYELSGGDWSTDTQIISPVDTGADAFGWAVDIDADGLNIVIGAPDHDNAGVEDSGSAWWYQWNGAIVSATPDELADVFDPLAPARGDFEDDFGADVSVAQDADGDMIALISRQTMKTEFDFGSPGSGTSTFRVGSGISPSGTSRGWFTSSFSPDGASRRDSVDTDGVALVDGFPTYLSGANNGFVGVQTWDAATNTIATSDAIPQGVGDRRGFDVAVDAGTLVTGAPWASADGVRSGEATVWGVDTPDTLVATLSGETDAQDDRYGWAVDVDGDLMAVSAINDDLFAPDGGTVYLYVRDGTSSAWELDATLSLVEVVPGDRAGEAVAVYGDRVAIGSSNRLSGSTKPGVVDVFRRVGPGSWVPVGATISGGFVPDAFGASVAFQDENTLVVGAPQSGGTGAVFQVTWDGAAWNPPVELSTTNPPAAGDQMGYSVAVSQEESGDHVIVAGAPGYDRTSPDAAVDSGALQIFRDEGLGAQPLQLVETGAQWGTGDRVGSAVASDRGLLAVAGVANEQSGANLQAYLLEPIGSNFLIAGSFVAELGTDIDANPNSYVDLVGRNLFLGRPGGGGQVGIFRDVDGLGFPTAPVDQFIPAGRQLGDAIGFALAADGRTLVAGGYGDDDLAAATVVDGDSGAAYSQRFLALSHTFVGPGIGFGTADNWDTGLVPGPNDVAIIPPGGVEVGVSGAQSVGSLIVGAGSTVTVEEGIGNSLTLTGGIDGLTSVNEGTIEFQAAATIDGQLINRGSIVFGGTASYLVGGDGAIDNEASIDVIHNGPGVTTSAGLTIGTYSSSNLFVTVGRLTIQSDFINDAQIAVATGATLSTTGAVTFTSNSSIEFEIGGPGAGGSANHGQLTATSGIDIAGTLSTSYNGYVPIDGDEYAVIIGCDCPGDTFDVFDIDPLTADIGLNNILLSASAPPAGPLTVDTVDDTIAADGSCSLREAITAANADSVGGDCGTASGADYIDFAVSGNIELGTRLPTITDEVFIDGSGQTVVIDGLASTDGDGTAILLVDPAGTVTLSNLTVTRGGPATCAVGTDTCGAVQNYGSLTIEDSTFSDHLGGGLTNGIAVTNRGGGDLTINRSTFVGNAGGSSGAIFNADAGTTLTIDNSTFSDNTAGGAGAIYNAFGATTTITNSTFVGNGGDATIRNAGGSPAIVLRNTIVTAAAGGPACSAVDPISADPFNFDTDGSCGGASTASIGELGLGSLADNGGPTETIALQPGSVAIDAAFYPYCSEGEIANQDQRGEFRPQGLGCDIGAFEAPGTPPANKVTSGNAGRDRFGIDVDVDGDTAVVAEVDQPGEASSVWVLTRDGGTGSWSITQRLSPGSISSGVVDVAIADGVIAAVAENGAVQIWEDSGTLLDPFVTAPFTAGLGQMRSVDTDGTGVFAAGPLGGTLWTPDINGTWQPVSSSAIVTTDYGSAVSIDGGTIVVAENDAVAVTDGRVFVYSRSGSSWSGAAGLGGSTDVLTAPLAAATDGYFGSSVAVQGSTLVVGQDLEDNDPSDPRGAQADAGAAWVYSGEPGAWSAPAKLVPADNDTANRFGWSVAIDGASIVVGASGAEELGVPTRNGAAYLYRRTPGGLWIEADTLRAADGQGASSFGTGVAVSGNSVIVGAPLDDNDNGVDAGAAYLFDVVLPDDPELDFDLSLDSSPIVNVAPAGLAVAEFSGAALERNAASSATVAASPLSAIDVQDAPLSAIEIGSTPLSAIVLESTPLSAIPLSAIDIDGGWDDLIAGTTLADVPFSTLTFDDALLDPAVNAAIQAAPLSAIDVNGTPLSAIPLSAIALGSTPLSAIPLSAIGSSWCDIVTAHVQDVSCTAGSDDVGISLLEATLRGVPLSAIPLSAIPLSAIDFSDPTVAASPLSAIPLSAINLNASPLSAIPLSAIPLSAIGPTSTPLSAIPLSAIGPASTPLSAIPLSAIQVGTTPLSAIPLSAIGTDEATLADIPVAIPLSAIPLSAIDVQGAPLSAIQVQGAPLSAIPLSAIALADTPLSDIELSAIGATDWCAVLADIDAGFDCTTGADVDTTTLRELSVRGVPLSAIPLSAIPLSAIPLSAIPLSAIPLSAIPLSAIPLSAIPLSAIDLQDTPLSAIDPGASPLSAIPLSAIPLSAIDVQRSPLSAIPLSAIPLSAIPLSAIPLSAIPLSAIPLSAIPLSAIQVNGTPLSAIPLSAIDVQGSPLSAIPLSAIPLSAVDCGVANCATQTLGEAAAAGAIVPSTDLGDVQSGSSGVRLGELIPFLPDVVAADVVAALEALGLTMDDLTTLDDLQLGDIAGLSQLDDITLADIEVALYHVRIADLIGALVDPTSGRTFSASETEAALRESVDDVGLTFGELLSLGDVTVGELVDGGLTITLDDIEPILGFITIQALVDYLGATGGATTLTLGDLTAEQLGRLTLADLFGRGIDEFDSLDLGDLLSQIQDELEAFSLGDLLLLLLDASSLNFGGADFEHIDIAELPASTIPAVSFSASFTSSSPAGRAYPVELELSIPSSASYVPGSAVLTTTDGGLPPVVAPLEPAVVDNELRWSFTAVGSDVDYEIAFEVKPQVTLGSTVLQGAARLVGTDIVVGATSAVSVAEGLEPNDFPPPEVTPLVADTIYLTYIPDSTDIDVFEITLADRDVLSLELSNLSADFDLAVYVDGSTTGAVGTPLAVPGPEDPIVPLTDPDQTGADAEVLDDFVRLDHIDPDLELIEVSNARGVENELIVTEQLPAGTYYVQVYGANGATSPQPAALQARVDSAETRPVCQAVGQLPTAPFGTTNGIGVTTNTLFLVNEMRLEQLHSSAERAAVMAELDALVAYLEANPALGIDPAVVAVDGFADIRAAYDAWDDPTNLDDACDPEVANAIVSEINTEVIDPIRDQIEYIVMIGGDDQIPMARLADGTAIANEYDYRHEFDGDLTGADPDAANSFTSAFWESRFLSDEPYGESSAQSLGNRYLYVSDAALGRLVETPDQIVRSLADFRIHQGTLDISTGAVLGYDFLSDGSAAVADELESISTTISTDLADGIDSTDGLPWDRVDAQDELVAAGQNALISLNAHFDHYRALPANGDQKQNFTDNLIASTVPGLLGPDGLAQSLIFSMGCHSGLAVPDGLIGEDNTDWAQQISGVGGIYIANTGFGYGDTETVAYTEQLMALFARYVTSPVLVDGASTTVGEAFKVAKNRFIADLAVLSVYDEKAMMESTFYGLPFYRTALPAAAAPPVPVNQPVINASGDPVVSYTITAPNDRNQTDRGVYYSNPTPDGGESIIVAPGRPIQPSSAVDVSVVDPANPDDLAQVAHGALIVDMVSNYALEPDPVIATPIFDEADQGPEPGIGEQTFPAVPVKLSTYESIVGTRQQLVVATGRYRSDAQSQRLDSDIDVLVNYAPVGETDFEEPTISNVTSTVADGLLSVSLTATDASAVDRVHVLVGENPGSATVDWRGFDLSPAGASRWTGSIALAASTTDVEFLVQAQDTVGNVGYATNKATNFSQSATPPTPPPPTPGLVVTVDDSNLDVASGWYTGAVEVAVEVASGSATAQYSVDGGPLQPVSGSFEITGDGIHSWTVVTSGNQTTNGVVRIDSTGSPAIVAGTPVFNGSYLTGTAAIDLVCTDPSLVSCDLEINGVPVDIGDPLPAASGTYVLVAVATDAFGNTTTTTLPFEITSPVSNVPVVVSIDAPGTPQLITDGVLIDVEFEDGDGAVDDYVVTIDWGDLVDEVPGTSTVCTATSATPQNGNPNCEIIAEPGADAGLAVAFFEYAQPGVYPVTVTVTDSVGNSDTSSYEFVVVYDPEAGRVDGSGWYWSGNEAYDDGDRWGNWAFFGYSARYKKNATVPSGTTKLRLLGEFYFKSTGYDYLLINDTVAVAEGVGKLDGRSGYRFRVQGVDNGWIDFFQITIWDEDTGEVVYDNGVLYDSGDVVLLGGIRIRS